MDETLKIKSFRGQYEVEFCSNLPEILDSFSAQESHFIVDRKVFSIYEKDLQKINSARSVILIDAIEENKSFEKMAPFISTLLESGLKRNHKIIAIGGGIIQDISCFIASILMRGLKWEFVPTTLLAQTDSCIGSKSSINFFGYKNIVGTFHAPLKVHIGAGFLASLESRDIRSGIGEMLKIHAIHSDAALTEISSAYTDIMTKPPHMLRFIHDSLEYKKGFIEADEFDENIRNLLNFGHSFGHAIESATDYAVPHGIAVTLGMALACSVSCRLGRLEKPKADLMRNAFCKNILPKDLPDISADLFFKALSKDKKNSTGAYTLILPTSSKARIEKISIPADSGNEQIISDCLAELS